MKRTLLFTLCLLYVAPCFSQNQQDIFLVGTTSYFPKDFAGIFDGFIRVDLKKKKHHKDNPISFHVGDPDAAYEVMLQHFNYYNKEWADLQTIDVRISDLNTFPAVEIINIDEFFADKRKEEVWRWMLYHHLSKTNIWVVDYNSAYKSSKKLKEPDMIKVMQVRIFVGNIPEEFRRSYNAMYHVLYGNKN